MAALPYIQGALKEDLQLEKMRYKLVPKMFATFLVDASFNVLLFMHKHKQFKGGGFLSELLLPSFSGTGANEA